MVLLTLDSHYFFIGILQWFWKWFPGNEVDKGCRFIRRLMAHILTHSCACHPYGLKKDENNEGGDDDMEPLVNWDASQWQGLRDSFELLRTLMLRKDATINYLGKDQLLPDGEDVDEEREQTSLFTKSFRLIMDQIEIHRIISPIRNALEVQTRKMGKKSIGKKRLTEVWNEMRSLDDKSIVKEALLNLFELVESGKGDDSEEEGKPKRKIPTDLPKLKSLSDLKLILQDPPFDLCKLQISVERILHRFNQIVTGGEDCALIKARYTIPEGSSLYHTLESSHAARVAESSARRSKLEREVEGSALEDLRRRSADLKSSERHGEDPLKKPCAWPNGHALRPRRVTMTTRKKTKQFGVIFNAAPRNEKMPSANDVPNLPLWKNLKKRRRKKKRLLPNSARYPSVSHVVPKRGIFHQTRVFLIVEERWSSAVRGPSKKSLPSRKASRSMAWVDGPLSRKNTVPFCTIENPCRSKIVGAPWSRMKKRKLESW